MSAQFGTWKFLATSVEPDFARKASVFIAPYAPTGKREYSSTGISIFHFPLVENAESLVDSWPSRTSQAAVITWDGRLDNREELARELDLSPGRAAIDSAVVTAAFERWDKESLGKFVGDWALSIWDPRERTLLLAKDFLGSRPLYYAFDYQQVSWSTLLDPLVLARKDCRLEEEYLTGWISFFPAADLTPYTGIHSVAPASYVLFRNGRHRIQRYWDFNPGNFIRYRADAEYEEHFREVFARSIRRRLRADHRVLAELSGGIDSSSMVCMADTILGNGKAVAPGLDTVSYFDAAEPNWNERPYFEKIEEKRGRTGHHIAVDATALPLEYTRGQFRSSPAAVNDRTAERLSSLAHSHGYRVLLSGFGGDEMAGGVPTPIPELANLLARARFSALVRQAAAWGLASRRPALHLIAETFFRFLPHQITGGERNVEPPSWLDPSFAARHRNALLGYPARLKLGRALPSFQECQSALEQLRRQLSAAPADPTFEIRYPYLDRDLLVFLFALPREQLVRPGYRRSLMRRSLEGIVPGEILHRRRKAFVSRGPFVGIRTLSRDLVTRAPEMLAARLGMVNPQAFVQALEMARNGQAMHIVALIRTLQIESWLQHLRDRNLFLCPRLEELPILPGGASPETARFSLDKLNV